MTRPLLIAGLTLLAVGVSAALLKSPSVRDVPKPLVAKPLAKSDPVDVLVAQLRRRFSDRQNVEFGYDRVMRPLVRTHAGPIADKNDLVYEIEGRDDLVTRFDPKRARRNAKGKVEIRTEAGTWIDYEDEAKDQMFAENGTERRVIDSLNHEGREIALYTFGAFDDKDGPLRPNGPAYLRQLGPDAPSSEDMKGLARQAWLGQTPTLSGWKLRFESVFADRSCLSCHNSDETDWTREGRKFKAGDRLGLFLIAEKK